jgi:CelD/BcsL family acetyltransferase involved in cellulose biosynthesis
MGRLAISVLVGEDAFRWLEPRENRDAWDSLYRTCPWSTVYLSREFFHVWAGHYGDEWNPVLVLGEDSGGTVRGVAPLAARSDLLTGAGAQQAEYQGWLSSGGDIEDFLRGVLESVCRTFPGRRLRLRYLPPAMPVRAVQGACREFPHIVTRPHSRPLLRMDPESLQKVLSKKSNRSKLNRLNRRGDLEIRGFDTAEELASVLDQIISMYDFRQGAVNDSTPFAEDERKKSFLLDWMQAAPSQLHASCMTLDGRPVAAHIGANSNTETHLAILAHSPFYSAFSPGKLHLYQSARLLAREGQEWLDLTPGGDPWKERFATDHDTVLELTGFSSSLEAIRFRVLERIGGIARGLLRKTGVSPSAVKSFLTRLRNMRPSLLLPRRSECRIYRLEREHFIADDSDGVRINDLDQLLQYEPAPGGQNRKNFLSRALSRLESGETVYSIADNQKLVCHGWITENTGELFVPEVNQPFRCPDSGTLVYGLSLPMDAEHSLSCTKMLQHMLADIKRKDDTGTVYLLLVDQDIDSLKEVIEEQGFNLVRSLYSERFLWRNRRWQETHL